jgi:hypothetical protein
MKTRFVLATAAVLVGAAALAQLRITSFNSGGELTWTNSARVGAYSLQWADSPAGPWKRLDTPTNLNLILAETNRITVQVPLTNAMTFYRVAWVQPDPIGLWEYRGYDNEGTLVITGRLAIVSTTLSTSNPPIVYDVSGWKDLKYAGTNQPGNLGSYMGTGDLLGTLAVGDARLELMWPPGCGDCGMIPYGTLWPNTYTGLWYEQTFSGGITGGVFRAERR